MEIPMEFIIWGVFVIGLLGGIIITETVNALSKVLENIINYIIERRSNKKTES